MDQVLRNVCGAAGMMDVWQSSCCVHVCVAVPRLALPPSLSPSPSPSSSIRQPVLPRVSPLPIGTCMTHRLYGYTGVITAWDGAMYHVLPDTMQGMHSMGVEMMRHRVAQQEVCEWKTRTAIAAASASTSTSKQDVINAARTYIPSPTNPTCTCTCVTFHLPPLHPSPLPNPCITRICLTISPTGMSYITVSSHTRIWHNTIT